MSVFHWQFLCSLSTHYIWHNIGTISQLFLWWIFAKKRALEYSRKEKCSQQIPSLPFNYGCWCGSVDLCFAHSTYCDDYWSWELGLCLSHSELASLQRWCSAFLLSPGTACPAPSAEQRIFSHESYWFPSVFSLCWERRVKRLLLGTNPRQWVHRPWVWEAFCWSVLTGGIGRNREGWPLKSGLQISQSIISGKRSS